MYLSGESKTDLKNGQVLEIFCRWQNFLARFSSRRFFVEESAYDIDGVRHETLT